MKEAVSNSLSCRAEHPYLLRRNICSFHKLLSDEISGRIEKCFTFPQLFRRVSVSNSPCIYRIWRDALIRNYSFLCYRNSAFQIFARVVSCTPGLLQVIYSFASEILDHDMQKVQYFQATFNLLFIDHFHVVTVRNC